MTPKSRFLFFLLNSLTTLMALISLLQMETSLNFLGTFLFLLSPTLKVISTSLFTTPIHPECMYSVGNLEIKSKSSSSSKCDEPQNPLASSLVIGSLFLIFAVISSIFSLVLKGPLHVEDGQARCPLLLLSSSVFFMQ